MRTWCFAFSLIWSFSATASAQSDSAGTVSYRADTTLVLIPITVTDSANRYVLGLEKDNFRLLEDGSAQTVKYFSNEDTPLSIGLLVDTSGSIAGKLDTSRQAAKELLKTLNAADEAFLVEFSDQAKLTVPLTRSTADIERRLNAESTGGLTALLDAVHVGLQEMKNAKNPRKALLIISDGGDNNSRYTASEVKSLVREADVQVFTIGVFEPLLALALSSEEIGGPRLLSQLSEQTGGRAVAATNERDLPGIAQRIGLELRNQYLLAYSPTNQIHDGKYRHVKVNLVSPADLPTLKARWRLGYYAPNQ